MPSASQSTVHPRGCGERRIKVRGKQRKTGSSPRVRGTPRRRVSGSCRRRFIPAGAGNAASAMASALAWSVHPRGCGERVQADLEAMEYARFIPAGAGNANRNELPWYWRGWFIPAGAGNAHRLHRRQPPDAVHPRGCGERFQDGEPVPNGGGSSPRVRGTRVQGVARRETRRFIPAGAGNAQRVGEQARPAPVHPRGCGERAASCSCASASAGSSPRVRGTLARFLLSLF